MYGWRWLWMEDAMQFIFDSISSAYVNVSKSIPSYNIYVFGFSSFRYYIDQTDEEWKIKHKIIICVFRNDWFLFLKKMYVCILDEQEQQQQNKIKKKKSKEKQ